MSNYTATKEVPQESKGMYKAEGFFNVKFPRHRFSASCFNSDSADI